MSDSQPPSSGPPSDAPGSEKAADAGAAAAATVPEAASTKADDVEMKPAEPEAPVVPEDILNATVDECVQTLCRSRDGLHAQ